MSKFAAVRIGDPYICTKHPVQGLLVTPGPPNPKQNVKIEDLPAAKTLDITSCAGPPQLDVLTHGCGTVRINDQLAVRTIQDLTLHQNNFLKGAMRTFIGVVGDSVAVEVPDSMKVGGVTLGESREKDEKDEKDQITPEEAQGFMNQFKKTDIPFDYPVDCCYARAREMCGMIEDQGFKCNKFWYGGDLKAADLRPTTEAGAPVLFPPGNGQEVAWRYHVAPVVEVSDGNGGSTKMILDPSLSNKPLTIAQWKQRVGSSVTPIETTTSSSTNFPWPNPTGTMSRSDAKSVMQEHRDNRDMALGK